MDSHTGKKALSTGGRDSHKLRDSWSHQELDEARKGLPLETTRSVEP